MTLKISESELERLLRGAGRARSGGRRKACWPGCARTCRPSCPTSCRRNRRSPLRRRPTSCATRAGEAAPCCPSPPRWRWWPAAPSSPCAPSARIRGRALTVSDGASRDQGALVAPQAVVVPEAVAELKKEREELAVPPAEAPAARVLAPPRCQRHQLRHRWPGGPPRRRPRPPNPAPPVSAALGQHSERARGRRALRRSGERRHRRRLPKQLCRRPSASRAASPAACPAALPGGMPGGIAAGERDQPQQLRRDRGGAARRAGRPRASRPPGPRPPPATRSGAPASAPADKTDASADKAKAATDRLSATGFQRDPRRPAPRGGRQRSADRPARRGRPAARPPARIADRAGRRPRSRRRPPPRRASRGLRPPATPAPRPGKRSKARSPAGLWPSFELLDAARLPPGGAGQKDRRPRRRPAADPVLKLRGGMPRLLRQDGEEPQRPHPVAPPRHPPLRPGGRTTRGSPSWCARSTWRATFSRIDWERGRPRSSPWLSKSGQDARAPSQGEAKESVRKARRSGSRGRRSDPAALPRESCEGPHPGVPVGMVPRPPRW